MAGPRLSAELVDKPLATAAACKGTFGTLSGLAASSADASADHAGGKTEESADRRSGKRDSAIPLDLASVAPNTVAGAERLVGHHAWSHIRKAVPRDRGAGMDVDTYLHLKQIRVHALMQLRRYDDAGKEVAVVSGIAPEDMPLPLQLAAAVIPHHKGNSQRSLAALLSLHARLQAGPGARSAGTSSSIHTMSPDQRASWRARVVAVTCEVLAALNSHATAVQLCAQELRSLAAAPTRVESVSPGSSSVTVASVAGEHVDDSVIPPVGVDGASGDTPPGESPSRPPSPKVHATPSADPASEHHDCPTHLLPVQAFIASVLGRVYLDVGDVADAEVCFALATSSSQAATAAPTVPAAVSHQTCRMVQLNSALLAYSTYRAQEARDAFRGLLLMLLDESFPTDAAPSVPAAGDHDHEPSAATTTATAGTTSSPLEEVSTLLHTAVNNYAITCVYLGDVQQAASTLEALVRCNPGKFLTPTVASNLGALYDQCCSMAEAKLRKRVLQAVAAQFHLTHLGASDFRLS